MTNDTQLEMSGSLINVKKKKEKKIFDMLYGNKKCWLGKCYAQDVFILLLYRIFQQRIFIKF